MRTALLALLLSALAHDAATAEPQAQRYVGPSALYSASFRGPWQPDPSVAEDGDLVLEAHLPNGDFWARISFSERAAPPGATTADLRRLSAAHWRDSQASSHWIQSVRRLRATPTRLSGAPALASWAEKRLTSGNRTLHLAIMTVRDGVLIRIELMAPPDSWAWARRQARMVIDSLRWSPDLRRMLEQADALFEDESRAASFELYGKPDLSGHARAQYMVGLMRMEGLGVERDQRQAIDRLYLAMSLGHLEAGYALGGMLLEAASRRDGASKEDICRAATYALARAAHSRLAAKALLVQARLFRHGYCVEKKPEWALSYYRAAADAGSAEAAADVAAMYEAGKELPKDDERAALWRARETVASGTSTMTP